MTWRPLRILSALTLCVVPFKGALAFCGFYVAKTDARLMNKASQVAMVREGSKTVLSMLNDYEGPLSEFAFVVPVPQVLQKQQIHVGDKSLFERLDAYSAPRLVEYFDGNPCEEFRTMRAMEMSATTGRGVAAAPNSDRALGVTVEAQYTVGEYDIVILSAKESSGLESWLKQNGYRIPPKAADVLSTYIKQNLKFFVAKVNLKEQGRTGLSYLRPIQIAYDSEKFMLPIRLGTINAKDDEQDLIVYFLTRQGRVETTNYRTVKLPTDLAIPEYVRENFPNFYNALFTHAWKKENKRVVFTEYFWDMSWCDPCAADPLSPDELRRLGVFWIEDATGPMPQARRRRRPGIFPPMPGPAPSPVMLTRLHVRYDAKNFPDDLMFQETQDRQNFQGRFILNIPWDGSPNACAASKTYFKELPKRQEQEAQNLAQLTGWNIKDIRKRMKLAPKVEPEKPWWEGLWKSQTR